MVTIHCIRVIVTNSLISLVLILFLFLLLGKVEYVMLNYITRNINLSKLVRSFDKKYNFLSSIIRIVTAMNKTE